MKQIRWLIFTILFLGVVAAGMVMSFNMGCEASVLNAEFYEEQFTQHNIYDLSQRYVLLEIRSGMNQQLAEPVRDALMHAVEQSFSPDWTRRESSRLIHSFIGYLTNQQSELDLTVDLRPRKDLLLQVISHQIKALPVPNGPIVQIIDQQTNQLLEMISQYLRLPDTVDLSKGSFFAKPEVQQYMSAFKHYYTFTPYLPYFLFFLLAALLLNRGIASGCKWFGLALALSSILFMVLLTAGEEEVDRFILQLSGNAQLVSLGADPVLLANLLKEALMSAYLKATLVLGAAGMLMAGCGWGWEHQQSATQKHKLSS
jgi:hypothetical protein